MRQTCFHNTLATLLSACSLAAGLSGNASATVIDTTTSIGAREFTCLSTYQGCAQIFGQSFTVTGTDTVLNSIGFNMLPVSNVIYGPLNVVLRIFEWDVNHRVGVELFSSGVTPLTHIVNTFVDFNVGLNLLSDTSYIAYLDAGGLNFNKSIRSGFLLTDGDEYSGGMFVYKQESGSNELWDLGSFRDSQFRAVLTAVPEAQTYAMMLTGLGLVGFATRRRKLAEV